MPRSFAASPRRQPRIGGRRLEGSHGARPGPDPLPAIRLGDRPAHPAAASPVGRASLIAFLDVVHALTGRAVFARLLQFRLRIFAIFRDMGSIVMPLQFGGNWSRFSDRAAAIIASLLAYEERRRPLPTY
jgi:Cytochrome bd terminal oxidase subunit I